MTRRISLVALPCLLLPAALQADDFVSFSMDFVEIGDAGNVADGSGYGAVGYGYRMGVHEVSRGMINAYNANSGGPAITLQDMTSYGWDNGASRPATGVSWNEAARFVNWLNTSQGHEVAYNFTTGGGNDPIALWSAGDAGYDPTNPFRSTKAYYFLPSEDEWYKAAYYDASKNGGAGGYWDYATGSDAVPISVSDGTAAGTAVYDVQPGPADITDAGGLSPYGTMAQSGNVWEWGESGWAAPNDSGVETRVLRGGYWLNGSTNVGASARYVENPLVGLYSVGFRVASVPEPSVFPLALLAMLGAVWRRGR